MTERPRTCSEVKRISLGAAAMPLVFTTGKNLYLAIITLYMLEMAPPAEAERTLNYSKGSGNNSTASVAQAASPGEKIPSPSASGQPTISLIFFRVSCSMSTKTGAIS